METEQNVGHSSSGVNGAPSLSADAAKQWVDAMGKRGLYGPESARFRVTAITRLTSVLAPEEPRDVPWIINNIEDLGRRYARLTSANPDTVASYVSRAKTALEDFVAYQKDPASFKGRAGSGRAPKNKEEKKKPTPAAVTSVEAPSSVAVSAHHTQPAPQQVAPEGSKRKYRDFPVDDGREIIYSFPEKLTMLELFKFMCHAAPLTQDFDITNPNHQGLFALAKSERAGHTH